MSERVEVTEADLIWVQMLDMEGNPAGRVGIASEYIRQKRVRHVDGWSVGWLQTVMEIDNQEMAAYFLKAGLADQARQWAARGPGLSRAAMPFPVVVLDVPDYPDEGGITLVLPVSDAERLIAQMRDTINEAKAVMRRSVKIAQHGLERHLRDRVRAQEAEALSCGIPGCRRERKFFDEHGIGYCKRHADERGIRPRGKV